MTNGFHFPEAVSAVVDWLDNPTHGLSINRFKSTGKLQIEWQLDLSDLGYPVRSVRLSIGPLFPATPCHLFVDAEFCLTLPHVEEDGRVCLDEVCQPLDFKNPVEAILRAITRFRDEFLILTNNAKWREQQLHEERLSYWARYCDRHKNAPNAYRTPRCTLVSLAEFNDWAEGQISAYIPTGSKHRKFDIQIVTLGEIDATRLAQRHGLDNGTRVNGVAAFVRIPEDITWTPSAWPVNFADLSQLIRTVTGQKHAIEEWLSRVGWFDTTDGALKRLENGKIPNGTRPILIILCQGQELYGYHIFPPTVPLISPPHVAPIQIERIDPEWALTRDHSPSSFQSRRQKRVLVLGCGSLGSPIIDVLARSGIANIDVVDVQLMAAANTSRHLLGLSNIRRSKAQNVATRVEKEIPGVNIKGVLSDAMTWVTKNCHPNAYDLILDCTAESTVRIFLARMRSQYIGETPIIHTWVEPFCTAAHVIASNAKSPWPSTDPAELRVNVADYGKAKTRVELPACSDGFHPYGSADILQAAGFAAERVIFVLDHGLKESIVWSFVRTKAFFDTLELPITIGPLVPIEGSLHDGHLITRTMAMVLSENE